MVTPIVTRDLGTVGHGECHRRMRSLTLGRTPETPDEIWLLEHFPVYTLGVAGDPRHLLGPTDIPVLRTDRGGQITYHGPGQPVAYLLLDLRRLGIGPRAAVGRMEQVAVDMLARHGISAAGDRARPGIYTGGRKIGAVGLRVTRGCCYHGMSLNVDMDLAPFANIRPCGHEGLECTQMRDLGADVSVARAKAELADGLARAFARPRERAGGILPAQAR